MKKIVSFNREEIELIDKLIPVIMNLDRNIYSSFFRKKEDLEKLGEIVSGTLPLSSSLKHFFKSRTLKTMAELLWSDGTHNILNIPTKAVLGRSFTITKINFFSFLLKIAESDLSMDIYKNSIQQALDRTVFTLMAEEVYTSIIENDKEKSPYARAAAEELVYLWEYRMDRNLETFAPPLISLWSARCGIAPVLGTLQGTVELIRLSANLPDIWSDFLSRPDLNSYIEQALEEFIFGMSYEEITFLRNDMLEKGVYIVGREKAFKILNRSGKNSGTCDTFFVSGEAKKIYSFFLRRKESARIRAIKKEEGPTHTIEELFLIFLLEKKLRSAGGALRKTIVSFFSNKN